ncbi:MAG: amidohydrolase [Robiginitomaculum sp.]|nr:MAG: amidohydrolase [Robiginitomaculum sp.]
MTIFKTLLTTVAISALASTSALAQTLVIKTQKLVTNQQLGVVENGTILIEDGRIKAIGTNADYQADKIIQGETVWVTPGIFAVYSHLGLVEVSAEASTNDINASDADAGLSLRASDSFNPHASNVAVSRLGGITHAAVVPDAGSTIFGGIGMVVSTNGSLDTDPTPRFIYVELGQAGANTAGGSRSAALGYLRSALEDVANPNRYKDGAHDGDVLSRYEASILRRAVRGEIPLMIGADRAADIVNIIKLKKGRMKIIIIGAAEGWMVADRLAAANISVVIDPIENLPYSFDALGTRPDNAKLLREAGVDMAIMTRRVTGAGAHNLRLLTQHAGNAVANGLSWDEAFKAITLAPATMMGMPSLGRLQAGQPANLVVWNGDPLEVTSSVVAVIIDGKVQDLTSRQTQLRDRYHPTRTDKPAYGYRP